jgi:hypothetical protein
LAELQDRDPTAAAVVAGLIDLEERVSAAADAAQRATEYHATEKQKLNLFQERLNTLEAAGFEVRQALEYVRGTGSDIAAVGKLGTMRSVPPVPPHLTRLRDKRRYKVDLSDLIAANVVQLSETLTARYKRREYQADMRREGTLNVHDYGQARALSSGASLITGTEMNGWEFWGVVRDGRWISLKNLRDSFLPLE